MARYLDVHPVDPQPRAIAQTVAALRDGGLIAYPTDSGYALGALMGNQEAKDRIAALERPEDPLSDAGVVLAELLPLDAERQAENEVWLAFTARALVDPGLRDLRDEAYDALRAGCERIFDEKESGRAGIKRPALDAAKDHQKLGRMAGKSPPG